MSWILTHARRAFRAVVSVVRADILALSNLVSFTNDSVELYGDDYSGDAVGDNRSRPIQPGRCYNFDGTNDFLNIGDDSGALNLVDDGTIAFWFKRNGAAGGTYHAVYQRFNSSTQGVQIYISNSDNTMGIYTNAVHSTSYVVDTNWHHYAFVLDTNLVRFYVDGSLNNTLTSVSFLDFTTPDTGVNDHCIGAFGGSYINGKLWGFTGYNTALNAASISGIYNGSYSATNLTCLYKMDESTGTTTYDSSTSGIDGTLTNITALTFHATDTGITYSWQNEVGYSDGGSGVLIPRDESDTANDVTGSALDYTGRVKYDFNLVKSNCANFDGTDDYADAGEAFDFNGEFDIRVQFNADDFSGTPALFGGSGADNLIINSSGTMRTRINNTYYDISGITFVTGTDYKVRIVRDGSNNLTYYVDDVEYNTVSSATGVFSFRYIGSRNGSSQFWDGTMWDLHISGTGVTTKHYPMCEGGGTQLYNVESNQDNATCTNISESVFWGERQDLFHYNIKEGFSKHMSLDGVDDSITLGVEVIDPNSDFSISTWAVFSDISGVHVFLGGANNGLHFRYNSGSFRVVKKGSAVLLSASASIETGVLYHVVLTRSSNTYTIYLGGSSIGSGSNSTSYSNVNQIIGSGDAVDYFKGLILNMALFDSALGSSEVTEIFNGGISFDITTDSGNYSSSANLQGYWVNTDNTTASWVDQSTNSNDGTLVGSPITIKLPASASAATDAVGNTMTNPASSVGGHNDAETKLSPPNAPALIQASIDEGNNVLFNSSGVAQDIGYSDFETDWNSSGYIFSDTSVAKDYKNLLVFDTQKTGDDLTNIQTFLNH